MKRIVEPEFLDELAPEDPRAIRSRRDLRRVNAWMRNHVMMADALKIAADASFPFGDTKPGGFVNPQAGGLRYRAGDVNGAAPKRMIELGAGDGDFLLRVGQAVAPRWPGLNVTLLDRQNTVAPQTLGSFAGLGWQAEMVVADVFEWQPKPADIIVANLFLHHFDDLRLAELFRLISEHTQFFIAIEPHRFAFPWLCGQLLWLIGCSGVTRHDAVASVAAGFVGREISSLWPKREEWQLTERRAGLFSHLFVARRTN